MNSFVLGIIGSAILVLGAALPDRTVSHPVQSTKNWLFAVGNLFMFLYAILLYVQGGTMLFFILQVLIAVSTVLMMLDIADSWSTAIIIIAGALLLTWSFALYEGWETTIFIIGITFIGIGFVMKPGTMWRNAALADGSICIAVFSYVESNWVFYWLNVFFALFSAANVMKCMLRR